MGAMFCCKMRGKPVEFVECFPDWTPLEVMEKRQLLLLLLFARTVKSCKFDLIFCCESARDLVHLTSSRQAHRCSVSKLTNKLEGDIRCT